MGYLSRRRGVISVFLLIIYVITYVFIGALVDAGRYRIAQTYAEAALDNASTSVLANYNKLLYDLYGLFSVDLGATSKEDMQNKIMSSYEQYLDESLGLANVDKDEYTTKLNKLLGDVMDSFGNENKSEGTSAKKTHTIGTDALYDFRIIELRTGTTITLADTANVENQIIEHMKYRAPVELVQEMGGFVQGLKELVSMGKQIGAISKKMEITAKSEYTQLPITAAGIPGEVDAFAQKVKTWANENPLYMIEARAGYFDLVVGYETGVGYYAAEETSSSYKNVYKNNCERIEAEYRESINELLYDYDDRVQDIPEDATKEERKEIEEANEEIWEEICGYSEIEMFSKVASLMGENSNFASQATSLENTRDAATTEQLNDYIRSVTNLPGTLEVKGSYSAFVEFEGEAEAYKESGTALINKITKTIGDYERYIAELEALEEENKDDSTIAGACGADIQIAKSSAGSLLEYANYLNKVVEALRQIQNMGLSEAILKTEYVVRDLEIDDINKAGGGNATGIFEKVTVYVKAVREDSYESHTKMEKIAKLTEFLAGESEELSEEYKEESKTDSGESKKQKAEDIADTKPKTSESEPKEEVEKGGKKIDTTLMIENPGLLDVTFQSTKSNLEGVADVNTDLAVNDEEMDAKFLSKLTDMGKTLVDGISDMLNGARDNLYINCYIMEMFPNYYMHYSKAEDNKNDKLLSAERSKYNASLAEVEFIITGAGLGDEETYESLAEEEEKGFFAGIWDWITGKEDEPVEIDGIGELSVKEFRTKLFGTRMLFNALSMLLDTSKYTQATSLSAWAGPLAPVVAIVLMIAWAVAETVIDTKVLMGELVDGISINYVENSAGVKVAKVPLLKLNSKQWFLSLEGVIKGLAETAIDGVVDKIVSTTDNIKSSMLNKADEAMFDMYEKAKDAASKGIKWTANEYKSAAADTVGTWMDEMTSGITELEISDEDKKKYTEEVTKYAEDAKKYAEDLNKGVDDAIDKGIEDAATKVNELADKGIETVYNGVSGAVMETLTTVGDKVEDTINSTAKSAGDKAKKFINDKIDQVLPEMADVDENAGCEFAMGYTDYLMFFLLIMDGDVKIKRVMALIQANMTNGMNAEYTSGTTLTNKFKLANCPVSVWADLELSMKYMFMSDQLVPQSIRRDGRMRLKVISAQSY